MTNFCYHCEKPVEDNSSAHLISSSPFHLACPECAQKHLARRPKTRRIHIDSVRPNRLQDSGLGHDPLPYRTVYASQECLADGIAVWRFNRRVPSNRLCKFIAAVQCMGTIDPRLWTLVRDFKETFCGEQLDLHFDYPNQKEAA